MYRSESIINSLLREVDLLSCSIINIKRNYSNTAHDGLRERLICENKKISQRLSEIFSIAQFLEDRNNEKEY